MLIRESIASLLWAVSGISLILLFAGCAVGLVVQAVFVSAVRHRHYSVWKELGSPAFYDGAWSISRFIRSKRYLSLDDRKLASLGKYLRWHYIVHSIVLAVGCLSFIAAICLDNKPVGQAGGSRADPAPLHQ